MTRPPILRLLRIVVSVVCGILCLLLIALWVRSYWWVDTAQWSTSDELGFQATSTDGRLIFIKLELHGTIYWPLWKVRSSGEDFKKSYQAPPSILGFRFKQVPTSVRLQMPHWFPVLLSGTLAVVVGLHRPYRFSLRTLLIATTLVAVVLGLVVAMR